jgi:hypothetical protein
MHATSPIVAVNAAPEPHQAVRESGHYRFCSGRCQGERPPEGGVELAPGKWRCSICWMEMARKRS